MSRDIFLPTTVPGVSSTLLASRPVLDGEAVNAANTNRMPQTNYGNAAYLHELIKRVRDTSGHFLYDVPVAEDVVPGDFVYYDGVNRVFAKGLAKSLLHDGRPVESEISAVWGVILRTRNGEADLCIGGLCEFQTELAAWQNYPDPGVRFLSGQVAGEPTVTRSRLEKCLGYLVGVKSGGEVQFFVQTSLVHDQRFHRHKSFELTAAPAGTFEPDHSDTILQVRTDIPGWIPVDHTVFAGQVPEGAKFGYNPAFLQATGHWPLRYAANAGLRWQRGVTETDDPLLASVPPEFYRIDETTIWWTTDVYLPWNSRIHYVDGEPVAPNDSAYQTRLWLDYIDSGYGLSDSLVSSLRTRSGSGLKLSQYPFGGPAATGDLLLDFELQFQKISETDPSGYAVKGIDKCDISLGPVVSGVKIDSSMLRVVHSDHSTDGYHFGRLVLGDPSGKIGRELSLEAVHLQGVEETVEREAIGLAFPAGRDSSLLARIIVPYDVNFDRFDLSLLFGILVTRSGNIASDALKLSYRTLNAPDTNNTITQAFPQSALAAIPCNFSVQNSRYSQGYYCTESEKVPVRPGDVFLLKIERTPPDNFGDRIILVRKSAILHLN